MYLDTEVDGLFWFDLRIVVDLLYYNEVCASVSCCALITCF